MSRRLLTVLTVVCVIALSVTAVALARSSSSSHPSKRGTHHAAKARGHARGPWRAALTGVARRLDVSPADLRAAITTVAAQQRGQGTTDLAAKKTAWIDGLATQLHKTPAEVTTAVRAELDAQLTQAVAKGWITAQGRTIALGCFDNPAGCDLAALRAQVRPHHGHPGHRHHPGSGRMTPGGRSTSAPLT
ncbi:MAG TPA: hypothetical protein VFG42_17015 [Baekduia sp.]|uniref:hypothetical protein n=1 Tax=Baekduia sp. TaxID=2600305 RepID=UPI002D77E156|nr:hypothetical protein [Baekduia sp.]HET6508496.1 hypothetical protein [Baekduia sp.]